MPALADDPILEKLEAPPPLVLKASESAHDKVRRALIAQRGQWMVLNARVKLSRPPDGSLPPAGQAGAAGRAGVRRFEARPFLRDDVWLVAAVYTPALAEQ